MESGATVVPKPIGTSVLPKPNESITRIETEDGIYYKTSTQTVFKPWYSFYTRSMIQNTRVQPEPDIRNFVETPTELSRKDKIRLRLQQKLKNR